MAGVKHRARNRITPKSFMIGMILAVIVLVFAYFFNLAITNHSIVCDTQDIDEGWDADVNGEQYTDITISETQFPMQNAGDRLTFVKTLPDNPGISNPVLCLYSIHTTMDVYLDDELVFTTEAQNYFEEILPGYGTNVVEMPDEYGGKELKVIYYVKEDSAFEGLQAPVIMDGTTRTQYLLSKNRVNLFIVVWLLAIGVTGMVASAFMVVQNRTFLRVFFIAAFAVLIGGWCMCNNEMMQLFVVNISFKSYIEYVCFYLMQLPFVLYFWDRVFRPEMGKYLKIYYVAVVTIEALFFVETQLLHFTGVAHYPKFVTFEHGGLVLAMIMYVMLVIEEKRVYKHTDWQITIGFGIAIALSIGEMIRFNLQRYILGFAANKYNSSLELAVLVIVVTLVVDFATKIFGALYRDAQNVLLTEMAYLDELTGLYNRRYFQETLEDISRRKKKYAIVNMDMNLLKAMNDNYGHQTGDLALKTFAEVLKMCYPIDSTVCRVGGDEFEVILPNVDRATAKKYVETMLAEMKNRNSCSDNKVTLSTAYGVADSTEGENSDKVFRLADERMYACKESQHLGRN